MNKPASPLRRPFRRLDVALIALRIGLGIVFVAHGIDKLQNGVAGVAQFFGSVGIPVPLLSAWVVTLAELLGGLALLLGALVPVAATVLAVVMIVAIVFVKSGIGLIAPQGSGAGAELDVALLAGLVVLALLGGGRYSLDARFCRCGKCTACMARCTCTDCSKDCADCPGCAKKPVAVPADAGAAA